jgi:cell division ATPase FtsA
MISLPSLFKKQKKEKIPFVLDIGTEAVKVLAFKKRNGKITVLGNSTQYFNRFGVFDSRDFETSVIKNAILNGIEEVKEQTGVEIKSVFLNLPASVFKAKIDFCSFSRKEPKEIISETEKNHIFQQVLKEIKEKISQKFSNESGILSKEISYLSLKILDMKIDGYAVSDLEGYKGKNLEFRILATFLLKFYFENFKKILESLNIKIFEIVHPVLSLINIFKKENSVFIDIGGELSQIFWINDGKLESVDIFDIGGKNFSQTLSESLGLEEEEARVFKERYSKKELSEEVRKRIKEIFSPEIQNWFKELKIRLKNSKILLPSKISLFGGGSLLPEIEEILEEGDWEGLSFAVPPETKVILPKDFKDIEDKTKNLNNPQNIPPLLLCYHAR